MTLTSSRGQGPGTPGLSQKSGREPLAGAAAGGNPHQSPHTAGSPARRAQASEARKAAGQVSTDPTKVPSGQASSPMRPCVLPIDRPPGNALPMKGRARVAGLGPPPHREPQREQQSTPPAPQILPLSLQGHLLLESVREEATVRFLQKDTRVPLGWLSSEHLQGRHPWSQDVCSLLRDGAPERCPRGQESQHTASVQTRPLCSPLSRREPGPGSPGQGSSPAAGWWAPQNRVFREKSVQIQ